MARRNSEGIDRSIRSIFSVLPSDLANLSSTGAIGEYQRGIHLFSAELPWVEQAADGSVVRVAISNLADDSSREILREQVAPGFLDLIASLEASPRAAGAMSLTNKGDAICWTVARLRPLGGAITILLTFKLFSLFVELLNISAQLSEKEKRVLFDLLGGLNVRQSAEAGDVSFETRRTQFKAACMKMECSGQNDVIRLLLGQLAQLPQICVIKQEANSVAARFRQAYLPPETRLISKQGRDGRTLRWFELGAPDAEPIMLIHGIMLPLLLLSLNRAVDLTAYKIVIPIRRGYLESINAGALRREGELVEQSIDDIAYVIEELGGRPITMLGHSFGALLALEVAHRYPELVRNLRLVAVNLGSSDTGNIGMISRLFSGLRNLANAPGTFRVIAGYFRKAYADEKTVHSVLLKMFVGSQSDQEFLRNETLNNEFLKWFSELYQNSILGISEDFHHVLTSAPHDMSVTCPILFVHGRDDRLAAIDDVRVFASKFPTSDLMPVDGGHLICATLPSEVLTEALALGAVSPVATRLRTT